MDNAPGVDDVFIVVSYGCFGPSSQVSEKANRHRYSVSLQSAVNRCFFGGPSLFGFAVRIAKFSAQALL